MKTATGSTFPPTSWDDGSRSASLAAIYEAVLKKCGEQIQWYERNVVWKKRLARLLRVIAILAVGGAGVLPMIPTLRPNFPAIWASIVLAGAGLLVGLDHYFGFSSAWMRFRTSEQELRRHRDAFELQWIAAQAALGGNSPTHEQAQRMLAQCAEFLNQVWAVVNEETRKWVEEFRGELEKLDQELRERSENLRLGAIHVEVANGDQCPKGWELEVDGLAMGSYRGRTAVVSALLPRIYKIRVRCQSAERSLAAEVPVAVKAGDITTAKLTLS